MKKSELRSLIRGELKILTEADQFTKGLKVNQGKMHKLLNIPEDQTISSKYTSGLKLAKDLLKANNGDQRKTTGMLAFAANTNKEENIFDKALSAMKKI